MIKRIFILLLITGSGYGLSIVILKYMASYAEVNQLANIAELDALVQLLIGLIGFGMQTEAIRNISFTDNWKDKLGEAQTARITFSFLLMLIACLYWWNDYYLYFLLAPLLAMSSDYALYAKGLAIKGSLVAFVRAVVPLLVALLSVYFYPAFVFGAYILSTALVYLLTNLFISITLDTTPFYWPVLSSLKLYLTTVPIGIINLCFYFFGLGILLVAQMLFSKEELVVSFLALKFYLIYKGGVRVIQQAFVNQMRDERVCLSIDKISIMLSLLFFGSTVIFPKIFISLFFGEQFLSYRVLFVFLGLASIAFSVFSSTNTRALLERRDISFMKSGISAVIISSITLVVLFQFFQNISIVSLSLLVGELIFAVAFYLLFLTKEQAQNRILFVLKCSVGFLLPVMIKIFFQEKLITYLISFSLLGLMLLALTYKQLNLPDNTKN